MKLILILFLILFSSISKSEKIAIIGSQFNEPVIKHYIEKLPNTYKNRIYYSADLRHNKILIAKVNNYDPDIILLIGDTAIEDYFELFGNKKIIYCCNFRNYKNLKYPGVGFKVDFEKLINSLDEYSNIYIIKTPERLSNILYKFFYENLKTVQITTVQIESLQELRRFFIKIPKNSIVINLLTSFTAGDRTYDHHFLSLETVIWNKKVIDIGTCPYFDHVVALYPNYDNIADKLLEMTLYEHLLFSSQVSLKLKLNYERLLKTNNEIFYEQNHDFFDSVSKHDAE